MLFGSFHELCPYCWVLFMNRFLLSGFLCPYIITGRVIGWTVVLETSGGFFMYILYIQYCTMFNKTCWLALSIIVFVIFDEKPPFTVVCYKLVING